VSRSTNASSVIVENRGSESMFMSLSPIHMNRVSSMQEHEAAKLVSPLGVHYNSLYVAVGVTVGGFVALMLLKIIMSCY
jgi:hypothetical protein